MDISNKSFGFIGLGLMGGSFAMAIKKHNPKAIYAYDTDDDALQAAKKNNVIDHIALNIKILIEHCDIIVLGIYPELEVQYLKKYFSNIPRKIILTDLSGLKNELVNELTNGDYNNIDFVSVHPMAGKELNGYENASSELFKGANIIITRHQKNSDTSVDFISSLYKMIGVKNIINTTAENHDKFIAYTSHLPHLLAVALCMDKSFPHSKEYIGKSFKDVTRVANINENLWTELFLSNSKNNIEKITELIDNLNILKQYISNKDYEKLHDTLKLSRLRKEELNNDDKS